MGGPPQLLTPPGLFFNSLQEFFSLQNLSAQKNNILEGLQQIRSLQWFDLFVSLDMVNFAYGRKLNLSTFADSSNEKKKKKSL